jgi:5-methylcytosine-specific restriction enzyme subunit McrC
MEKIFESYVANVLKDKLKNHRVDAQDSSFYLVENQHKFRLRPDIVIDNKTDNVIIADTKWKKVKPADTNY